MSGDALAEMTATELLRRFRTREVSPVEATEAVLARIDRFNDAVNAYNLVDREGALAAARRSAERYRTGQPLGQLDGVTVAIKDIFNARGWPNRRGSRLSPEAPVTEDAPAVAACRRHGAIFPGKTTTPELGWKGITDSPLTGVTRNPWDTRLTPGGSSGGSAAALPLGMATLTLGTDGGGSIRIPAGFTGVVGFKPTFGRVPHAPPSAFGQLAHAGPLTWTVEDAALMQAVLTEPDVRDTAYVPSTPDEYTRDLRAGVRGLRVAYSPTLGYVRVDAEVRTAVDAAVHTLVDLGTVVDEVDPGFDDPLPAYEVLWNAGAARAASAYADERHVEMDPGLVRIIEDGRRYSAVDYIGADLARTELAVLMQRFHQRYDLLVTPTLPIPAFPAGQDVPDGWHDDRWPTWTPFSYPFNVTQQPALSVPCGFTAAGLPIGLQIVGAKHRDALVLRAGYAYQAANPLTDRRPTPA